MRQDTRLGLTAATAALGTAGGALALYGLGVSFAWGALALAAGAGLVVRAALPQASPAPTTPDPAVVIRLTALEATIKTLSHDLRGALSPAMMVTDRLIANPDPAIARAGQSVLRSVTRASEILDAARPPPNPPGYP